MPACAARLFGVPAPRSRGRNVQQLGNAIGGYTAQCLSQALKVSVGEVNVWYFFFHGNT